MTLTIPMLPAERDGRQAVGGSKDCIPMEVIVQWQLLICQGPLAPPMASTTTAVPIHHVWGLGTSDSKDDNQMAGI